jgi:hypothetical protein
MPVLVNLYASTVTGSSVVFDSRPLAAGPHTLTITVGPPNAGGGKVIVDAVNEVGETPAISYTWDSPEMNGFVQDLSNLQATGTKIILTIGQISPWMTGTTGDINVGGTDGKPSAGYPTNVSDYSAWTSAITALLDYLASQSITNVIAVGAPNELVDLSDATQLNAGYTALSTVLTSGCQNGDQALCVQLFGPDFRRSDITTARGDTTLDSTLGFYDYHAYYSVGELNVGNFASDLTAIASHSTKPVWITEFGEDTGGTTGSSAWQSYAKFMIQGLDYGAAAMSLWNFQAIVFSGGGAPPDPFYSLVGPASGGYTPTFTYYAYSSVTAHTLANSTVFSTTCSNCTNVQMAVLRSSSGANAILVYNGNTTKWSATVDYGAPVSDTLYRYVINSSTVTSGNLIAYDKVIAPSGSTYAIGVPANSFAVFSSINPYSG